jgi:hypothetical protein
VCLFGVLFISIGIQEVKQDTLKDKKHAVKAPALKPLATGENFSYFYPWEIPVKALSDCIFLLYPAL